MRIRDLIDRELPTHAINHRKPEEFLIDDAYVGQVQAVEHSKFEDRAFAYLHKNRKELGVNAVYRFRNQKADGLLVLDDETRIAIEIKERLNIQSGCHAFWQLLAYRQANGNEICHALIIFGDFARDWDIINGGRHFEIGWVRWYTEHHSFYGLRIHLLQLTESGHLTYFDIA